jgi:hypothetical protein
MISIGLYGDSFTGVNEQSSMKYHWSTAIANELECTVVNYGAPGSSIYYSYKKFVDTHQNQDLNIFLITDPHRYIKPILLNNAHTFVPNILYLDHVLDKLDKESHRDLRGWFMCSDVEHNLDMIELMLEKIRLLDSNVIFLGSCFSAIDSHRIAKKFGLPKYSLFDIQKYMFKLLNISEYEMHRYLMHESDDLISGHLTPEINEIVANVVLDRMNSGVWNWDLPKIVNFKHNKKDYWNI